MEQQLIDKAQAILATARNVVILTHMSPDGDAMGSSLGMKHAISVSRASLARVSVVVPNAFPDFLAWLPGAEDIVIYEKDIGFLGRRTLLFMKKTAPRRISCLKRRTPSFAPTSTNPNV